MASDSVPSSAQPSAEGTFGSPVVSTNVEPGNGNKLPPELLLEVLHHVTRTTPFNSVIVDTDTLLAFSHVCRLWRQTAVSFPTLWRDIDVLWPKMRTKFWLERAKEQPLRLLFDEFQNPDDPNLDMQILDTQIELAASAVGSTSRQITLLSVRFQSALANTLYSTYMDSHLQHVKVYEGEFARSTLTPTLSLSFLRNVEIFTARRASVARIPNHPLIPRPEKLHSLHLLDILPRSHWPRSLRVSPPPRLRQLSLTHLLHPTYHEQYFADWNSSEFSGDPLVHLNNLETLCLGAPGTVTMFIAYGVFIPRLRTLLIGDDLNHGGLVRQLGFTCASIVSLRLSVHHAVSFLESLCASDSSDNPAEEGDAHQGSQNQSLFPHLQEVELGPFPEPFESHFHLLTSDPSPPLEEDHPAYTFDPAAPTIPIDDSTGEIRTYEPASERPREATLEELLVLLQDDGALRVFIGERAKRGYPRLKKLHVHVPTSLSEDDSAQLKVESETKDWLRDAADEVVLNGSRPWDVVTSEVASL